MSPSDPQFLYLILILPFLFGLALIGEGIKKIVHDEWHGLISVVAGLFFLGIVFLGYLFFSTYLNQRI